MSLARLAIAGLVALVLVFAATAGSALLLAREQSEELQRRADQAAELVRGAYALDQRANARLLTQLCQRDRHIERLARELSAGGEAQGEAARAELALSRALDTEVWLLLESEGELRRIAATARAPARLPSRAALLRARKAPVLFAPTAKGSAESLLQSCQRQEGNTLLWVVRREPLARLRERALPQGQLFDVYFEQSRDGPPSPPKRTSLALRIEGSDGEKARSLWVRVEDEYGLLAPLSLAPLVLLAIVLGALLAYFAVGRKQLDDSILVELEQAAERVAMGDLSSRIGRRSAGRADQTFQTFDRMTEELREMRARLADAERATAWQDMARRIAHEIKNPLSPIQMAMETLRKAHQKRLPAFDEIFEESTRAILDEVRRMERIVREFSEFARLPKPRPGLLELSSLVEETAALYRPEDVRVEVVSAAAPLEVRVDREQITQVIVNLLQNALEAARGSEAPHVVVRVEARPPTGAAQTAFVHVDDNGRGVPVEERERVFEPYYTTKEHGTGLGLAIVRRIALDHGGNVQVQASPLGGARFTLRLPCAAPDHSASMP